MRKCECSWQTEQANVRCMRLIGRHSQIASAVACGAAHTACVRVSVCAVQCFKLKVSYCDSSGGSWQLGPSQIGRSQPRSGRANHVKYHTSRRSGLDDWSNAIQIPAFAVRTIAKLAAVDALQVRHSATLRPEPSNIGLAWIATDIFTVTAENVQCF